MKLRPGKKKSFWQSVGPGFITGAADDDPSGIGTFTQAGAQFGSLFLWTALFTWPLMASVQMACARIGMVTGEGLSSALQKKISRPVLIIFCLALFLANTLNVGADLAAMADAAELVVGGNSLFYVVAFGAAISWATIQLRYSQIAKALNWLALFLFSYVITAFLAHPRWSEVLHETFAPHWPSGKEQWSMLVAILGTTISPYLFFWQSSQEVEEEKKAGRILLKMRTGATKEELKMRRYDVAIGTFFSNLVMFFIILTTALILHKNGITQIETSKQAAQALEPIAGKFAAGLYTLGLLGVGFLAIPTLTGSAAYALAETFKWAQGLDAKLFKARGFYSVIIASMAFAIAFDFLRVNPLKALYASAVVNGLLSPFLLLALFFVIKDDVIMKGQPSSKISITLIGLTTLLMFIAIFLMFYFN